MTLKRGDYFGEMALMLDEPRHANVIATAKTACFRISRYDFVRLFGSLQEMLQQQMQAKFGKEVENQLELDDDQNAAATRSTAYASQAKKEASTGYKGAPPPSGGYAAVTKTNFAFKR